MIGQHLEFDKLENNNRKELENGKEKKLFLDILILKQKVSREGKGQFGLCKGLCGLLVKGPFMVIWSHQPLGN